jgi:hypothetical protein
MNKSKTFFLILFISFQLPQHSKADLKSDATEFCQKVWDGTKNFYQSTIEVVSPSKKEDPRIFTLRVLGLGTSLLGLWIIKKGIDTLTYEQSTVLQKQLNPHSQSFARGLLATSFGVVCAISGIILVTTSKPIIERIR